MPTQDQISPGFGANEWMVEMSTGLGGITV